MTSFSIDDVRETMPREVTAFLAGIESAASDFLDAHPAANGVGETKASSLLRSIRHSGHAIYGTSSLVSATTLASCADLVERLAERGHAELIEAQERVARARRVVELLPAGVEHMRAVLALALKHENEEAEWLVAEWQSQAEGLLADLVRAPHRVAAPSLHPAAEADSAAPPPTAASPVQSAGATEELTELRDSEIEFVVDEVEVAAQATQDSAQKPGLPPLEFSFDDWEPAAKADAGNTAATDVEPKTPMPALDPASSVRAATLNPSGDDESVAAQPSADENAEFSFGEDDEQSADAEGAHADLHSELLAIFQDEAREAVVALQGYLNALAGDSASAEAAAPLERIYHTLKGAAATVGLGDVSQRAEALQHQSEALIVATQPIDETTLASLVDATNQLFALSGLDNIRVSMPAKAPLSLSRPTPEVAAIFPEFVQEAREIHEQAATLVAELSSPAGAKFTQAILATLAPLFHRLKGSARLVGEDHVAELAGSLEDSCESSAAPTTAALSLGLARIASKLGFALAVRKAPDVSDEPRIVAATRLSFENEAKELLDSALRLTRDLRGVASSDSATDQTQSELAKLFHHLGGSARIVGNSLVADEARALEGLVQDRTSVSEAALASLGDRLAILRARFGVDSQASVGPREGRAQNLRERVEFAQIAELWHTFTAECSELMESIERTSFMLEESSSPKEQLKSLMRLIHTLKGVVNTIGLTPTGRTLHRVEDLLETLLEAAILPPARNIASLLIEIQAEVRRNLKEAPSGFVETAPKRLEARIAALLSGRHDSRDNSQRSGGSRNLASEGFASAGSAGSARSSAISLGDGADRRVIRVSTERLDALMNLAGELVVSRSRLTNRVERLRLLQTDLVRGSRRLLDTVDAFREEHEFANLDGKRRLLPTTHVAGTPGKFTDDVAGAPLGAWGGFSELELDRYEGIHVLTRSLAELTSDFSEMHAQLSRGLSALTDDADTVGGIVSGIQTEVTRARMVPLEVLFLRLRLPLRDAALRERKDVRVSVSGEDVPVDKTIADALFQPMLHLVRNAVVHGIEDPERRARQGKERAGMITLNARQESGQIVIEVRDDGAGLDLVALHARGVEMGLLPADIPSDHPRVTDMVFVQGLSTHRTADDVAGRGVGGDVVKRAVDRLNGSIRVESRPGSGTAFLIRLPLTLAITRALVVRNGEQSFAVPLHFAERIIDAHEQEVVHVGDLRRIKLDGAFVPIRTLNEFFGSPAEAGSEGPVLILRVGDARIALQVEAIVAHEEIVVKSLGSLLSGHPSFAGITIRGTGELVLIVDVPSLVDAKGTSVAQRAEGLRGNAPRVGREIEVEGEAMQEARAVHVPAVKSTAGQRKRVLFVDDSVSVRKVAEMQLRELGVDVITAVDGVDAMAKLREHKVDVLFTDLEMPRMHGYELIRELRFLPAYKDLPIVVVTSRSGRKHQDQAKQLGASEYLTKPFTVQVLEAALKKWTRSGEASSGEAASAEETLR